MSNMQNQQGVGLVEVLVALVVLALGVLGFAALQLRALDAAQEAAEQTVAMNTARDLAERIRVNRTALSEYKKSINEKVSVNTCTGTTNISAPKALAIPKCNAETMAQYDATEILEKASAQAQTIVIANCVQSSLNCVYVAWGNTTITPTDISQCVNTTTAAYVADAKCLVMEAF